MKAFYPAKTDEIMHISKNGRIYQLDSFWKMRGIYESITQSNLIETITIDETQAKENLFKLFHTEDFTKALMLGKGKECFIESCGVFWQPILPLAMSDRAKATIEGLEYLVKGGNLSVIITDGGHHTTPFQAFGFCPINSAGIGVNFLLKVNPNLKIVILDLDIHQGNGFSYILNKQTIIFDIWNKKLEKWPILSNNPNYKSWFVEKPKTYFEILRKVLEQIKEINPDILIYYSGVDVLDDDRMRGIKGFNIEKLKEREDLVFNTLAKNKIKTLIFVGGGYVDYSSKSKVENNKRSLINKHMITFKSAVNHFKKYKL